MHSRMTGLVALLFVWPAWAQDQPSEPPLPSGCGVCAEGAQCLEGRCQFACETDRDCHRGLICVSTGGEGRCESRTLQRPGSPPTIRRGDATHPERYKFSSVVPQGFHLVTEPYWGIFAYGAGFFALSYLPYVIVGTLSNAPLGAIPIVGPILAFRPATGFASQFLDFFAVIGIGFDVLIQCASAAAMIASIAAPTQWLERDEAAPVAISVVPGAAGAVLGASLVGRF